MGRASRPAGWLPAEERPPPEGGQREGADREDLAKRLATHQHRRSAWELHTHRPREGRGRDSGWSGTATEKETLSESPARARTRTLGLAQVNQRKARTARRQQETTSAQATVPGSREGTGPTAADGTRGSSDAEAGTHDGGDDAWHVTGPRL